MSIDNIGKALRLDDVVGRALAEFGYTVTDIRRHWEDEKGKIVIRYYDRCEPTWNYTHHSFEMPLTGEEYENYANAALDKIVPKLKKHARNTRKELYLKAYPEYKEPCYAEKMSG
ncbi:hypothetical protein GF336_04835 [Candidatus Woesearchaeota archaeon]|nr:hypothetical protein [Candidatus Woesearchaeota archaeon]